MGKPILGVLRADCGEGLADGLQQALLGARLRRPQPRFDLAPHPFDGVEVGRVGRQECPISAGLLNERKGLLVFVRPEIVPDHCISGAQRRTEDGFDVNLENLRVGRPVERQTRRAPIRAQGTDHRRRTPVSVRGARIQASRLRAASIPPCQVGLCCRFVNQDKSLAGQPALPGPPRLPGLLDVLALLFAGAQGLFL